MHIGLFLLSCSEPLFYPPLITTVERPACGELQENAECEQKVIQGTRVCHQRECRVLTCHTHLWAEVLGVPLRPTCDTELPEGQNPAWGGTTPAPATQHNPTEHNNYSVLQGL
jgi:hypothetical protein